jgi:hypothetical protein
MRVNKLWEIFMRNVALVALALGASTMLGSGIADGSRALNVCVRNA